MLDQLVHEAELLRHRWREHERVGVDDAHAPVEAVERDRQGYPASEQIVEVVEVERAGGQPMVGRAAERLRLQHETVGSGGAERVDHVKIVRPRFRPIFPRVHAGVRAHEVSRPSVGRTLGVVAPNGLVVIVSLVAEYAAERGQPLRIGDQAIPVVVTNLVAKMSDDGSIAFAELLPQLFSKWVIGFGNVDGDEPIGVPSEDLAAVLGILHEREREAALPLAARFDRQSELPQRVEQVPFRDLQALPRGEAIRFRKVRDDRVQAACEA